MKFKSRNLSLLFVLCCITGCALLPENNINLAQVMARNLKEGDLRTAYDIYQLLSAEEKSSPEIVKHHKTLQRKIRLVQDKTQKQADQAIALGDWKSAGAAYREQILLIEASSDFRKHYQGFLEKLEQRKRPLNNDLLLVRAQYLLKKREAESAIYRLDPKDERNARQFEQTKAESVLVSKRLLTQGLDAIRSNDISGARQFIPLAQQLSNTRSAKKAMQTLEEITNPLGDYIDKLTERGTDLYSKEDYNGALEIWLDILYLDPNNTKVQASRERTEKVLQSLNQIKRENDKLDNEP